MARVRPADEHDLPALVDIYNHYVGTTHITFDTEPFAADDRRSWFASFSPTGPHRLLVADVDRKPVGYASSGWFRAKPAYVPTVETTVYLDPAYVGRGIGRQLYGTLLDELRDEPMARRAYAGIALPNPESIALHERLGFRFVGTFHETGFKFERYVDVSWFERGLTDDDGAW